MKMKKLFLLTLIVLCAGVIATTASAAIIIDEFTDFDLGAIATGGTLTTSAIGWRIEPSAANSSVTVSETGLSNVLGGTRFTTAEWTSTFGNSSVLYSGTYDGETGYFFLNTGAGSVYGWVDILYDNGGVGLSADFSGESAVYVRFDPDHLAFGKDSIMQLTLEDSDSTSTLERRWVSPDDYVTDPGLGPLDVEFMLSDFSGITLTDIQSVKFFYEGDFANDVAFHEIATVPVPAAVWLLGSGLIGLVGIRKKFKQ
ncbi:MAG: VPLPA-CTERM sorting domain-containing protein [Thermodesulfobacteriota bacterium]|nr:VPLPA-CTERM sorting domain-containing protein [Thermodesulfobacteriota bacterium]